MGTLMGKDPFGNSYYELPAQPQVLVQPTNLRDFESTLHSWESGCLLDGTTLQRPTEKRFSSKHISYVCNASSFPQNQVMGMHESAAGFDTNLPSEW